MGSFGSRVPSGGPMLQQQNSTTVCKAGYCSH